MSNQFVLPRPSYAQNSNVGYTPQNVNVNTPRPAPPQQQYAVPQQYTAPQQQYAAPTQSGWLKKSKPFIWGFVIAVVATFFWLGRWAPMLVCSKAAENSSNGDNLLFIIHPGVSLVRLIVVSCSAGLAAIGFLWAVDRFQLFSWLTNKCKRTLI